jgi:penicillin-binding protein 2
MFERRLKIFLGILLAVITVLLLRAIHLQVFTKRDWLKEAEDFNKKPAYVETTRGRILDHNGCEIAVDEACMDACVDYRAISRSAKWIDELAQARLKDRLGTQYTKAPKKERESMVADEAQVVNEEIDRMWDLLARESNQTREAIDDVCHEIDLKVAMRTRYLQYKRYQLAEEEHADKGPSPWYRRWLIEGGEGGPKVDDFEQESTEQVEVHPILRNISQGVYMRLAKAAEHCPGLVLRAGTHRNYPYHRAGCHLIGSLGPVNKQDIANDPNLDVDDLRRYDFTDLIGRGGIEQLAEPTLRGTRGKVWRQVGKDDVMDTQPIPGGDVKSTIDIEMQGELQQMFAHMKVPNNKDETLPPIEVAMHGAAVVIDVKTAQVRALASYPDFDVNELAEKYEDLVGQTMDAPLMNRATQSQLEPGSTIKPAVGLGAITQGKITPTEGIECTGFLVLGGRKFPNGRCWVASRYLKQLGVSGVAHHQVPQISPHRGSYGNPDGFLCYADALERSCNVYFETCADRLGLDGLSNALELMGLGHETGLGIPEACGRLPRDLLPKNGGAISLPRSVVFFSGIGQVGVLATPIQMANVAATIARDGIWMRPRLIENEQACTLSPVPMRDGRTLPDQTDLGLNKEALKCARDGMFRVVNSEGGTGKPARMSNLLVAGKTGTAQAAPLWHRVRDAKGDPVKVQLVPATADHPTDTPWFRAWGEDGTNLNHAWFIGFAPANDPQVAFAVMIQYGGSGALAAKTATAVLEKCIEHGYVKARP